MKPLMKALAVLLALLVSPLLLAGGSPELNANHKTTINQLIEGFKEGGGYTSITVLINQQGQTLYSNSVGMADIEQERPATANSAYAIGSITKSFTALAILQLVEAGKVNPEQPVSAYLPDYTGPGKVALIRQLLDHTSGIPNYTNDIPGLSEKLRRTDFSREDMVGHFADLPLQFTPGEKFNYTNSGYYLLGLIIEKVSGLDYYEYLEQNVFAPLDMQNSYSGNSADIIPWRARGYDADENGLINATPWWYLVPYAAGSLIMTAEDLVKYRRGVFHSNAFSPALRKLLTQSYPLADGTHNFYAQGALILSTFEGHEKVSHSGDIWGFAANHAYYPDDDLTIVILTNRQVDAPSVVSLEQKIAREVFGVAQPEVLDLEVEQAELDRIQGDYYLHPFIFGPPTYGFVGRDGKLFIKFGGMDTEGPGLPLLSQGNGRYLFAFDDEWSFQFDHSKGQAGSFTSSVRDGTFGANRVK